MLLQRSFHYSVLIQSSSQIKTIIFFKCEKFQNNYELKKINITINKETATVETIAQNPY